MADTTKHPKRHPNWTPAEARRLAKKGGAATAAKIKAGLFKGPRYYRKPTPKDFQGKTLMRLQEDIKRLQQHVRKELQKKDADGQRINWLATAFERMLNSEFALSGRPKPGNWRPAGPPKPQSSSAPASFTLPETPAPVAQPPPAQAMPEPETRPSHPLDDTTRTAGDV